MTAEKVLFAVFALSTCGGAIGVVLSQNIARMAFWLIISLGSTAGLFFLQGADFVGSAQLMVYVGGTLVLLIFGVMLTASGPYVSLKTTSIEWVTAAIVSCALLGLILVSAVAVDWNAVNAAVAGDKVRQREGFTSAQEGATVRSLGLALIGIRADKDLGSTGKTSVGYLLPFEIVSVHLLVVLIGAAYLARAKRRVDPDSGGTGA